MRGRSLEIRKFILEVTSSDGSNVAARVTDRFGISRQAVNRHLSTLVKDGWLVRTGRTQNQKYRLAAQPRVFKSYALANDLAEDRVWTADLQQFFRQLPDNVRDIWMYTFTEMFNNAIDHSGGTSVDVNLEETALGFNLWLHDDGIGIFRKIQAALGLADERHAVLELSKGKLTTDPTRHTGEGIFFTSRMLDYFAILSGGIFLSHSGDAPEDQMRSREAPKGGTTVFMELRNDSSRRMENVFDEYTSGADRGFTKTEVSVRLLEYGDDKPISRSQAKRLLAGLDRFKRIVLDFAGVQSIGRAFADEIFRVFAQAHPGNELVPIGANPQVQANINAARSQWVRDLPDAI